VRAPYTRNAAGTSVSAASRKPLVRDIDFVAGDEVRYKFLFKGKVWTSARPEDALGRPMYAATETAPTGVTKSPTALVAPWERRYWFSQVRDSYVSSVRYYNGWVPWYGMRPDWVWWRSASLAATFDCVETYSVSDQGTVVEMVLPDYLSKNIRPMSLIAIFLGYFLFAMMSAFGYNANESYVSLLGQWGMLIMGAYFGGRTIEKLAEMRGRK
jgi:hypothetical protein